MPTTDLLVQSPAPFGSDADFNILSKYPCLYLTDDSLGLWLDLDDILPTTLLRNVQAETTWGNLNNPGNTTPAGTQGDQHTSPKFKKPGKVEKEPQTEIRQTYHCRHRSNRSTASATGPDFQTKLSQRERFREKNRLAASRCRQKKKESTQHLKTRFRDEAQKKRQLEGEIAALRGEILDLKDEVLKYALCEDGHVGRNLAQTMQRITQGTTAGAFSSPVSAYSSTLSPVSASLVTATPSKATSSAATAANIWDKSSLGAYGEEGIPGGIGGETLPFGLEESHLLVDRTATELIDEYTYLT